jgi:hypothetical protein
MRNYRRVMVFLFVLFLASTAFVSAEDGQISVTIPVGIYDVRQTPEGQEVFVEEFGRLLVPGKPNLPSRIFAIAIPPGAEVAEVNFDLGESFVLPGRFDLSPTPLPRVIGEENPLVYQRERRMYEENFNSVYGSDEPYPASVVEFVRKAGYRKYNLVDVRVTPFSYRPQSGQLTYYPEVVVNVSYSFPKDYSPDDIMIDNLSRTESIAQDIVLNYEQAKGWYPNIIGTKDNYDFVIITLDNLTSYVTPLVNWETAKGRSVNVVTTSWIDANYSGYDLAEKMRNFLRDKYPSSVWGIEDVLLVGDYDDVPMRRCAQDAGYGQPETDLYYAELSLPDDQSWDDDQDHRWGENSDPIDFYSEVNVGRIPHSATSTVQHICEKSVAYEQNDSPLFKKNILLLGAFFWPDTDNAVLMELKVDQPWMSDWTMTRMYEQGHSTYPMDNDLTFNNVKTVWSSGQYAFVNWAGHGSPYSSHIYYGTGEGFATTSTCPHLNDDFPSIIFADACSNSDTDYPNIGRAMLAQGGVGFLGATKVAYGAGGWSNPYHGSSQSFDYFFTTSVTSGDYTQGEAHQWALRHMYTNGLWYMVKYEMFEWGAFWGNPDLGMAPVVTNLPPQTPSQPSGIAYGQPEIEYQFSVSTSDPEGDSISYLFDWGDSGLMVWLGPFASGETCIATHTWDNSDLYQVQVKAKDIHEDESGWSQALPVTICIRGDCNGDKQIDAADVVSLVNYLFNAGSAPQPLISADCNCDTVIDPADVVYLINYLYKSGPSPSC